MTTVPIVDQMAALTAAAAGAWPAWSGERARGIPGVGRALSIYTGLIGQMPMQRYRGPEMLPATTFLQRPDPDSPAEWFVGMQVDDYLMHGNAVHVVTGRNAEGWPSSVTHLPAARVTLTPAVSPLARPSYAFDGAGLPADDVVHVRRGCDPMFPRRGMGVMEQHLRSLGRIYHQEAAEDGNLTKAAVPSVAVIAPNPRITDPEIRAAKEQWEDMYGGPVRRPGIFPHGTAIQTLSWTPTDAQMIEARQFSLVDIANVMNLDSWWLSAPGATYQYKSPAPMFSALLKTSINPVAAQLEAEWSFRWLPWGQRLRFDRRALESGSYGEAVGVAAEGMAAVGADGSPLFTTEEARAMIGMPVAATPQTSAASPLPTGEEG